MKINMFERERAKVTGNIDQDNIDQIGHETLWNCVYTPKYTKKDFQRNHYLFNMPLVKVVQSKTNNFKTSCTRITVWINIFSRWSFQLNE